MSAIPTSLPILIPNQGKAQLRRTQSEPLPETSSDPLFRITKILNRNPLERKDIREAERVLKEAKLSSKKSKERPVTAVSFEDTQDYELVLAERIVVAAREAMTRASVDRLLQQFPY